MTNNVKSNSEIALFIHQMIPHRQNAVNMAKALLKSDAIDCDDISNDEDPYCVMEELSRSIVNEQNYQIQQMRAVLEEEGYESEESESCFIDPLLTLVPTISPSFSSVVSSTDSPT